MQLNEKNIIRVGVDFNDPNNKGGVAISITENLSPENIFSCLAKEGIIKLWNDRTFKIEGLILEFYIEKGSADGKKWEEIKEQLEEIGFFHVKGQPTWFNVFVKGNWDNHWH